MHRAHAPAFLRICPIASAPPSTALDSHRTSDHPGDWCSRSASPRPAWRWSSDCCCTSKADLNNPRSPRLGRSACRSAHCLRPLNWQRPRPLQSTACSRTEALRNHLRPTSLCRPHQGPSVLRTRMVPHFRRVPRAGLSEPGMTESQRPRVPRSGHGHAPMSRWKPDF